MSIDNNIDRLYQITNILCNELDYCQKCMVHKKHKHIVYTQCFDGTTNCECSKCTHKFNTYLNCMTPMI